MPKQPDAQAQHKPNLQAAHARVKRRQAERAAQLRALADRGPRPDFVASVAAVRSERERAEQISVGRLLLSAEDLWALGIRYSRVQLWKLVKAGLFPAPIKISTNRNAWVHDEIVAWLEQRVAERDEEEVA